MIESNVSTLNMKMINSGDEQLKITQKQKQQRGADAKKEIKLKAMHQHEKIK